MNGLKIVDSIKGGGSEEIAPSAALTSQRRAGVTEDLPTAAAMMSTPQHREGTSARPTRIWRKESVQGLDFGALAVWQDRKPEDLKLLNINNYPGKRTQTVCA